jgi:hypothetical protein
MQPVLVVTFMTGQPWSTLQDYEGHSENQSFSEAIRFFAE